MPMRSLPILLILAALLLLLASGVSAAKGEQTLTGTIDVIHADDFAHPENTHYAYYLRTATQRYQITDTAWLDPSIAGATVTVRGTAQGADLTLAAEPASVQIESVAQSRASDNIGAQRTLGIVMSIDGAQPPATVERVRHELFDYAPGPLNPTTSTTQVYYNLTTYGKTRFVGEVVGPYAFNSSVCGLYDMLAEGLRAASATVDVSAYDRIVIVPGCTPCLCYGAMGTNGKIINWQLPDGRYVNISVAWLRSFNTVVTSHELGHNFGGNHASSLLCQDENQTWLQYGLNCAQYEYADAYDALGSGANEMNAIHRTELGWLDKKYTKAVASDAAAEFVITDLDRTPAGSQIHQLTMPVTRDTGKYAAMEHVFYSVEYRTNMHSYGGNRTGVGIRLFKKGPMWYAPNAPYNLIQTTLVNPDAPLEYLPQTPGGADGLLNAPGDTYTDDINGYRIALVRLNAQNATVRVERIAPRVFDLSRPIVAYAFDATAAGPGGTLYVKDAAGYAQPATAYNLLLRGPDPTTAVRKAKTGYFSDSTHTTPDSVSSYLATGGFVPALVKERQALTIAMWMWAEPYVPAPGYPYDLNLATVGNTQFGLQLSAPDQGLFIRNCFMKGSQQVCARTRTDLPSAGAWHHVAAVYDGTTQYLYVDGVLKASSPKPDGATGLAFAPAPTIAIGGYVWDNGQYNGYLDDVSFWARALTASDVKGLAAIPPSLT